LAPHHPLSTACFLAHSDVQEDTVAFTAQNFIFLSHNKKWKIKDIPKKNPSEYISKVFIF
jgi:hypothetical protein